MDTQKNTLLLHACCAPCTLMPLTMLIGEGWDVALFYSNANIYPQEEYDLRLATLAAYAKSLVATLYVDTYSPDLWEERIGIYGGPYPLLPDSEEYEAFYEKRSRRCRACYALRFEALAREACVRNTQWISSTLAVSPYQYVNLIHEQLRASAQAKGLQALETDWRPQYPEATRLSRELGMYRQKYCGCRFSKAEAELERQAQKAARKIH